MQPTANVEEGLSSAIYCYKRQSGPSGGNSFFTVGNSSTVAQLSTVVPVEIDTPFKIMPGFWNQQQVKP